MGWCAIIGSECPETSDSKADIYCPAWDSHGIDFTDHDGRPLTLHCVFQCMGPCLMHTVKMANSAREAAESHRNATVKEIANGFIRLTNGLTGIRDDKISQNNTKVSAKKV